MKSFYKKKYFLVFFILLLNNFGSSQICFKTIAEHSSIEIESNIEKLEPVACELIDTFPMIYHDSFAIYNFSYYALNEYENGEYEKIWNDIQYHSSVNTPYYLIIGVKNSDQKLLSGVDVKLRLPSKGKFACIDLISENLRDNIQEKVRWTINNEIVKNDYDPIKYFKAEIEGINVLKDFISGMKSCCEISNMIMPRSETMCSPCINSINEIFDKFDALEFSFDIIKIISDPEWMNVGTSSAIAQRESILPLNAQVSISGTDSTDIDLFIDDFINRHIADLTERLGITPSIFVQKYKFPRDCAREMEKWDEYTSNNSELKFFFIIINVDNQYGYLGFHNTSNIRNLEGLTPRSPYKDMRADEYEGLKEIYENAKESCSSLVYSAVRLAGAIENKQSWTFLSDQEKKEAFARLDRASKEYNDAIDQFSYYYKKELEIVKKGIIRNDENDLLDVRARWRTRSNMCSETMHDFLDLCGLDPTFGTVCDIFNVVLYSANGDVKNASLSLISILPLGDFVKGSKMVSKVNKLKNYVLTSTIKQGKIWWVGGHKKLITLVERTGFTNVFDNVVIIYNKNIHEVHHLIPWAMSIGTDKTPQHSIMKRLCNIKWHPSDPNLNGFVIPQRFANGKPFHSNAPKYDDWVTDALNKINNNISDAELLEKMNKFTDLLKTEIQNAWKNNKSINDHFRDIDEFIIKGF